MASTEAYEVVLSGGGPWGFRLQGGKEFRAPLRIAKVTLGSKADKAGISEGLTVRSINNSLCDDWTHSDALNCIKKSGMVLELVLSKRPDPAQSSSQGRSYSYTTDDVGNSPKVPVPAEYKQAPSYVTLPRGQQWVDTESWKGSQSDDKDSAFSSPGAHANFGSNEWNPDIISNAMRTPEPIKMVPSSEMYRPPSQQNPATVQVKAPENVRGFVDKPRPIGRGGRRLHTESTGSDDMNNNLHNGDMSGGDSASTNRPAISHLRYKKEEAAVEATREPKPVAKVPPPAPAKPTRKPSQDRILSDSDGAGPHRPSIKRGGQWYKDLFKEMHSTAGTASNLSALLANDAMKGNNKELDRTSASSSSPRSGSPSVEHPENEVFHNNKASQNHSEPIRSSHSVSLSSEPRSSTSSVASGDRKPSRSGHVPAWYKELQRGSDVPVQKIEEPQSYIVHKKQRSYDSLENNFPTNLRSQTTHAQVSPAARLGVQFGRKASSPAAMIQTVQMEQMNQPPSATSLYESRFQRRVDPNRRASEQIPLSHRPDEVIRKHEEEARRLKEEEERRKREDERRRMEEERRKQEEERQRREEEAERRRLEDEQRKIQEQEAERRKKIQEQEEAARRAAQQPQFVAKALYTFKPQSPQELPFRKGDTIPVTRQIDKNWVEGVLDGRKGIFPRNYVELMPYEEEEEEAEQQAVEEVAPPAPVLVEGEARMKYNFKAESGRELACNKGDIMSLIRRVDDNWYDARIGNTRGIVPVRYVEVFREPELVTPAALRQEKTTRTEVRRADEVVDKRRSAGFDQFPPQPRPSDPAPREVIKDVPRNTFPVYSQPDGGPQVKYMTEPQVEAEPMTEPLQSIDDAMGMWNLQGERFRAVFSYVPHNEDELALDEGDEVLVLEKCDDGWFVGTSSRTNMFGTFPGNYVVKV